MKKNLPPSFEEYKESIEKDIENSTIFGEKAQNCEEETPKNGEKIKKNQEKTQKKRRPYIRMIAVLIAVALISGAGVGSYFLWFRGSDLPPYNDDPVELINLTASADIPLSQMEGVAEDALSNIKQVHIVSRAEEGEHSELTIIPYAQDVYTLYGVPDVIPLDYERISALARSVFEVTAVSRLSQEWSREDCGLEEPTASVAVTMADGSEFSFSFGSEVPNENRDQYGESSLYDGIYVVQAEVYETFLTTFYDLVDRHLIAVMEPQGENDEYFVNDRLYRYESIRMSGQNFPNPLRLGFDADDESVLIYRIVEPVSTFAFDERIAQLLSPFNAGFSAALVYRTLPSEEDLAAFGLDDPFLTVEYEIRGEVYTLRFSAEGTEGSPVDRGFAAVMINDLPVIYGVLISGVDFFNWSINDIRNNLLYLRDITTISAITAEYGGNSFRYEMSFDEVREDVETEGDEQLNVTLGGAPIDSEDFRRVYQRIVLTSASRHLNIGDAGPGGAPYLTVRIHHEDGTDVITYTRYNQNYFHFQLNGIGDELIAARNVERLRLNFERVRLGEPVPSPAEQQ